MIECVFPGCDELAITSMGPDRCAMHLKYKPGKKKSPTKLKKAGTGLACRVPGCERESPKPARGLCWTHYGNREMREKHALLKKSGGGGVSIDKKKLIASGDKCLFPKCENGARARGLCWTHSRNLKAKDEYALPPKRSGGRPKKKDETIVVKGMDEEKLSREFFPLDLNLRIKRAIEKRINEVVVETLREMGL